MRHAVTTDPFQVRRLCLVFAAVVCGLALSACDTQSRGESEEFGAAIVRLGDQIAAEVDGSPIYVSDVHREGVSQGIIEQAETLDPASPLFGQLLEELVDQRLLAQEAIRRNLNDSDEARRRLAAARERILGNILVESVVDGAVTEDALRRMYEEQVKLVELGDEVRARHILVDTYEEAEEIVALISGGGDFAAVALERSKDPASRLEGGDLGYFTPDMMTAPFQRAAFETEVGAISKPFKTEFGWHVLRVEDRRAEQRPTFEEMRARIVRFMTFDEIQRLVDVLRAKAEVRTALGPASAEPVEPEGRLR